EVVAAAGMRGEPRVGVSGEAAAEIGAHEVMRAVGGGARDREHAEAERRERFDEARFVELRVHGVAGAGVGGAQIELRPGRGWGAVASEAPARGSAMRAAVNARNSAHGSSCGGGVGVGGRWSGMA